MLKFFALFILLPLGILSYLSLLTYSYFWYETANGPHLHRLEQLSEGKPKRIIIKGLLASIKSMILVVLCFPLAFRSKLWAAEPNYGCTLPPVIFVHGLYHNASAWTFYRWWFRKAGFINIYAFSYSSWKYSFDELLQILGERIGAICNLFPGNPPILIGHSLGGLLSRAYIETYAQPREIAAVITLGAPHRGSKLAVLGLGKLAKDLKYQSQLINELEERSKAPDVPCLAIYSPVDNMVLPAEALQVAHPGWDHHETYPTSHVGMLFSPRVAKWLLSYLLNLRSSKSEGRISE